MTVVFVDTNVLCYVHDANVPAKRARAEQLLASLAGSGFTAVISTQVLQEFYNTLTRKLGLTPAAAKDELILLADVQTVLVRPAIILAATDLHASASLSFWDALVIAAAQSADCDEIWTEDLQDGQRFGKLKAVNPFKGVTDG